MCSGKQNWRSDNHDTSFSRSAQMNIKFDSTVESLPITRTHFGAAHGKVCTRHHGIQGMIWSVIDKSASQNITIAAAILRRRRDRLGCHRCTVASCATFIARIPFAEIAVATSFATPIRRGGMHSGLRERNKWVGHIRRGKGGWVASKRGRVKLTIGTLPVMVGRRLQCIVRSQEKGGT